MRRLFLILFSLCLFVSLEGQMIINARTPARGVDVWDGSFTVIDTLGIATALASTTASYPSGQLSAAYSFSVYGKIKQKQ